MAGYESGDWKVARTRRLESLALRSADILVCGPGTFQFPVRRVVKMRPTSKNSHFFLAKSLREGHKVRFYF